MNHINWGGFSPFRRINTRIQFKSRLPALSNILQLVLLQCNYWDTWLANQSIIETDLSAESWRENRVGACTLRSHELGQRWEPFLHSGFLWLRCKAWAPFGMDFLYNCSSTISEPSMLSFPLLCVCKLLWSELTSVDHLRAILYLCGSLGAILNLSS